ncbi:pectinesterase family protein [Paenibacillus sp. JX-17]|uniref:Pectinesterase n=1 Tax=Paenibacillus lacisoli TaxID=3064525 RepID=A0ABT9C8F1_9BACL|nr:pectinesterase family protein [Paenibacillus sp. JX-17]MDO7905540.1 pectinesterase family protein [Paenibacillus sp. JX-17]
MSPTLIVCSDGDPGAFRTIQAAVDHIPQLNKDRITIRVMAGTYREKLYINKPNVEFIAEGPVLITWSDFARKPNADGKPMGTFATASVYVTGNDVSLTGFELENDAGSGEEVGQAVAVYVDADRIKFRNCVFRARQDTLYLGRPKEAEQNITGRIYLENCRIVGDIDFIFGSGTAWFEACDIVSVDQGQAVNGYITAAATPMDHQVGLVFHRCRLISDAGEDSVYLGRPWRDYARTVFLRCWMGDHIKREGWHDWDKTQAVRTTVRYAEYASEGPGAAADERVSWASQLTDEEAGTFRVEACLGPEVWWAKS